MTNCQKKSLEGWLLKCADNGLQMRLGLIIGVPSWEGTAHCLLTFRWVHFHSYVMLQSVCPCDETHLFCFFPVPRAAEADGELREHSGKKWLPKCNLAGLVLIL